MAAETAIVIGMGIVAYLTWQVAQSLDVKDEKQDFLRTMLIFYFSFVLMMIPEYLYLQNIGEGVLRRFFVVGLWFLRFIVSIEFIIIVKQIMEWVLDTITGWFGK